jgi:hypothetical protein
MKQFFGPYIPPEQLDKNAAGTLSPGSYGEAISKAAPVMDILHETLKDIGKAAWVCKARLLECASTYVKQRDFSLL